MTHDRQEHVQVSIGATSDYHTILCSEIRNEPPKPTPFALGLGKMRPHALSARKECPLCIAAEGDG